MEANSGAYTFALHALSSSQHAYLMKSMQRLYESILGTVNKAGIADSVERTELSVLKEAIYESTAAFK